MSKIRKTFVLVTVNGREESVDRLIKSISDRHLLDDIDINILYQYNGSSCKELSNQSKKRVRNIFKVNGWLGCHLARQMLLEKIVNDYDIFINLDDDMLIGEKTDYSQAISKCLEFGVGFVITNWRRLQKQVDEYVPKPVMKKQICMYQGGGMVYNKSIAKLILKLPKEKTTHDMWSLWAYINGYENYYDYSSVTLHEVCQKGGMSTWFDLVPAEIQLSEYINIRYAKRKRGNGHDILIPIDSDINKKARDKHKENKEKLNRWKNIANTIQ